MSAAPENRWPDCHQCGGRHAEMKPGMCWNKGSPNWQAEQARQQTDLADRHERMAEAMARADGYQWEDLAETSRPDKRWMRAHWRMLARVADTACGDD